MPPIWPAAPPITASISRPVAVDMKRVKARKDEIVAQRAPASNAWMEGLTRNARCTAAMPASTAPKTVAVGGAAPESRQIFINIGGRAFVPAMPGLDRVPYLTNSSMMEVDFLPEHLLIVGGSYIGLEFAQMYPALRRPVTVVEMADRADHARGRRCLRSASARSWRREGITVRAERQVHQRSSRDGDGSR